MITLQTRFTHKRKILSKKVMEHSVLGDYTKGDRKNPPRLRGGCHSEEGLKKLRQMGIHYNIVGQYPNGVRVGNIPSHKDVMKRNGMVQTWFPKNWTKNMIRRAGERIINSSSYISNKGDMFGTYKKVRVVVKHTKGKPSSVYPHYKQSGGLKIWK